MSCKSRSVNSFIRRTPTVLKWVYSHSYVFGKRKIEFVGANKFVSPKKKSYLPTLKFFAMFPEERDFLFLAL